MSDADERLTRCFLATFPDLRIGNVDRASADTVKEWDSLHAMILIAILEEAFGLRIPPDDYPLLRSYASVHHYLRSASPQ